MSNYSFSDVPVCRYNRSKFPLNQDIKTTINVGDLVPFYVQEVLPGDTMSIDCKCLSRVTSSFIKQPMDVLYQDIRFFFVPNRIIWEHWEELMGANKTTFWSTPFIGQVPQVYANSSLATNVQTVGDYLGVPFRTTGAEITPVSVSQLPARAFAQIWNDWWRDENLQSPVQVLLPTGSSYTFNSSPWTPTNIFGLPPKSNKFHDYFTSCLPAPQKGDPITFSLLGNAPVFAAQTENDLSDYPYINGLKFRRFSDNAKARGNAFFDEDGDLTTDNSSPSVGNTVYPSNLIADLTKVSSINVNDLRLAFQTQKMLEKDARGGTRYIEMILSHFGVQNPDARLQRSEYLGGTRTPVQTHEVPQTSAPTADSPLAEIASYAKTIAEGSFTKSFTEHGFIIGVTTFRHKHTYQQGIEKFWTRKDRLDFYDPVFANIGEQPVLTQEIFCNISNPSTVFGYQEAWADYRYRPDRTSGYMRSGFSGSLDIWHFGDFYSSAPVLSDTWIKATPQFVDRTLSVPSTTTPNFICEFYVKNMATRVMPTYSVPGLIDHH